jgi:hypothetical protein
LRLNDVTVDVTAAVPAVVQLREPLSLIKFSDESYMPTFTVCPPDAVPTDATNFVAVIGVGTENCMQERVLAPAPVAVARAIAGSPVVAIGNHKAGAEGAAILWQVNPVPAVQLRAWVESPHAEIALKLGPALLPVKFPKTVFAAALLKLKVNAGVVVAVATEVVNSGERVPAENDVTVPPLEEVVIW